MTTKASSKAKKESEVETQEEVAASSPMFKVAGFEVDLTLEDGKAILSVDRQDADFEVHLSAGFNALPLVNKVIDSVEKMIPGDQTGLAKRLKAIVANLDL